METNIEGKTTTRTQQQNEPVTLRKDVKVEELYDVLEELGKGRFGKVYRCLEKSSGKPWAGKFIKAIKQKDKTAVRTELSIMNELHHPNLLQCVDAFEAGSQMVMILEFVSGGELFERVIGEDFPLSEGDVILFMRQICEGVQYMHDNNILHLDLKPENIMCVDKTGHRVKLIDFGLARRFESSDDVKVMFGTPEFVAPEVVNYDQIGFATDMWSVGVICYVLLSGLSPFMGDSAAETLNNVTAAEWDFEDEAFDNVSEDAKDFIEQLLERRKEKRLSVHCCLVHHWLRRNSEDFSSNKLCKERLRKFVARRRWQKTANAVRAIGRMTALRLFSNLKKSGALGGGVASGQNTDTTSSPLSTTNHGGIVESANIAASDEIVDTTHVGATKNLPGNNKVVGGGDFPLFTADIDDIVTSTEVSKAAKAIQSAFRRNRPTKQPELTTPTTTKNSAKTVSFSEVNGRQMPSSIPTINIAASECVDIDKASDKESSERSDVMDIDSTTGTRPPAGESLGTGGSEVTTFPETDYTRSHNTKTSRKVILKPPEIDRPLRDCEVCEGSAARFDCRVKGYPEPEIYWYKDGKEIETSRRFRVEFEDDDVCSLIILEVEPEDDGRYTCEARNCAGRAKCSAELLVEASSDEDSDEEQLRTIVDAGVPQPQVVVPSYGNVISPSVTVAADDDNRGLSSLIGHCGDEEDADEDDCCLKADKIVLNADDESTEESESEEALAARTKSFSSTTSSHSVNSTYEKIFIGSLPSASSSSVIKSSLPAATAAATYPQSTAAAKSSSLKVQLAPANTFKRGEGGLTTPVSLNTDNSSATTTGVTQGKKWDVGGKNGENSRQRPAVNYNVSKSRQNTPRQVQGTEKPAERKTTGNAALLKTHPSHGISVSQTKSAPINSVTKPEKVYVKESNSTPRKTNASVSALRTAKTISIEPRTTETNRLESRTSETTCSSRVQTTDNTRGIEVPRIFKTSIIESRTTSTSNTEVPRTSKTNSIDAPRTAKTSSIDAPRTAKTSSIDAPRTAKTSSIDAPRTARTSSIDASRTAKTSSVGAPRTAKTSSIEVPKTAKKSSIEVPRIANAKIQDAVSRLKRKTVVDETDDDGRRSRNMIRGGHQGIGALTARFESPKETAKPERSTRRDPIITSKVSDRKEIFNNNNGSTSTSSSRSSSSSSTSRVPMRSSPTARSVVERYMSPGKSASSLRSKFEAKPEADKQPQFLRKPQGQSASEGESVKFTCKPSGVPFPSVTWLFKGKTLKDEGRYEVYEEKDLNYLEIFDLTTDDSGSYTCKLLNSTGRASSSADLKVNANLRNKSLREKSVPVDKAPVFDKKLTDIEVDEGSDARLECAISGQPAPEVTWLYEGKPITECKRRRIVRGGGKNPTDNTCALIIANVSEDDDAVYTCTAKNRCGSVSCTAEIIVELKPSPRTEPKKTIETTTTTIQTTPKYVDKTPEGVSKTPEGVEKIRLSVEKPIKIETSKTLETSKRFETKTSLDNTAKRFETAKTLETSRRFETTKTLETSKKFETSGRTLETSTRTLEASTRTLETSKKFEVSLKRDPYIKADSSVRASPFKMADKKMDAIERGGKDKLLNNNDIKGDTIMNDRNGSSSLSKTSPLTLTSSSPSPPSSKSLSLRPVPKTPKLPEFLVRIRSQTVTEPRAAKFTCLVKGTPKPTVAWSKDDGETILDDGRIRLIEDNGEHTLDISETNTLDSGRYTCTLSNDAGKASASANLTVNAQYSRDVAPKFLQNLEDIKVKDGESAKFSCKINTASPNPTLLWLFKNKEISPNEDDVYEMSFDGNTATLALSDVLPEDEGEYTCRARNSKGSCACSARLIVQVDTKSPPPTSLSPRSLKSDTPVSSEPETIPDTDTYIGQHSGKVHNLEKPTSSAGLIRTVATRDTNAEESDYCQCPTTVFTFPDTKDITDGPSEDISMPTKSDGLTKAHSAGLPEFVKKLHDIEVVDGSSVVLSVTVKGKPLPDVMWIFDECEILEDDDFKLVQDGDAFSLEIREVYPEDAGVYTCRLIGDNDVEVECTAHLQVKDPEGQPAKFLHKPRSINVDEGNSVKLSCKIEGDPEPTLTWYKDDEEILPGERILLGMSSVGGLNTLEIPAVLVTDAGNYTCTIKNELGVESCTVAVRVQQLQEEQTDFRALLKSRPRLQKIQSPPSSVDRQQKKPTPDPEVEQLDFRHVLTRHVQTKKKPMFMNGLGDVFVREGDEAVFECNVEGLPEPTVSWTVNGKPIKESKYFQMSYDGKLARLTITEAFPEDDGEYKCIASNSAGTTAISAAMKVSLYEDGNDEVQYNTNNSNSTNDIRINGDVTHIIASSSSRDNVLPHDEPDYDLDKDGPIPQPNEITPDSPPLQSSCIASSDQSASPGEVPEIPLQAEDVQQTESSMIPKSTDNPDYRMMNGGLEDATVPVFDEELRDEPIIEGSAARMQCRVLGYPEPDIVWFKDGQEIHEGRKYRFEFDDEDVVALLINNATMNDLGLYTCRALNRAGTAESSAHLIAIETNPPKVEGGPTNLQVVTGQTLNISCKISGKPTPEVTWYKDRTELQASERIHIDSSSESSTSLVVTDANELDAGRYSLCLENDGGRDSFAISVSIVDKPEPPTGKPIASNVSRDGLTLSWSGAAYDGGSRITGYIVEVCKTNERTWGRVTRTTSTSHVVRDLESDTEFLFRVSAENAHGVSDPSDVTEPILTVDDGDDVFSDGKHQDSDDETEDEVVSHHVTIKTDTEMSKFYELKEQIGKGRFGVVYRCLCKSTGKTLAAKFIKSTPKEMEAVREEIAVMNELHHPKLLQCVDAFEMPRQMVVILEMIAGGELFERVIDDDFILTERDVIKYMRQVCAGVQHMHRQSILHLDLKPENIMCVDKTGSRIKLIDFGLARKFNPKDDVKVMFGTPEFVAPEVINYDKINFGTDMWSVGVICYILLSGLSPFMGDNDAETLTNVTLAEWDFEDEAFDDISDDAKEFIEHLLVKSLPKRNDVDECLQDKWLIKDTNKMKACKISKDNFKKYVARRRWQKTATAVRALGRMASLTMISGLKNIKKQNGNDASSKMASKDKTPFSAFLRQKREEEAVKKETDDGSEKAGKSTPPPPVTPKPQNPQQMLADNNGTSSDDSVITASDENITSSDIRKDTLSASTVGKTTFSNLNQDRSHSALNGDIEQDNSKVTAPAFIKKMVDCEVFEGDCARFDCKIIGEPEPDVTWLQDGIKVEESKRFIFDFYDDGTCSLIIKKCIEDDDAEYTFKASNSAGEISCTAELIVDVL